MNYLLRTFRGVARTADLCQNGKEANLMRLLFLPIFLVLFSFNGYSQGNALDFDGIDDYVSTTAPDFYSGGNFTIEGWFKSTDNEAGLVSLRDASDGNAIFVGLTNFGAVQFLYRNPPGNAGGQTLFSTSTTMNDGNWHHYACVKDGSQMLLYIDGAADGSTGVGANFSANQLTMVELGRNTPAGSTRYYDGEMDEIRFWDKALTASEISANYNVVLANPSSTANLVVYYDFDAISGTTIPDVAGNSHVGTINLGANTTGGSSVSSTVPTSASPTGVDFNAPAICADATEWLVPISVGALSASIGAVSMVLDYDATKMTYQGVHSANANLTGAALDNSGSLQVSDNNGKITISWANSTAAAISNATLLTLRFVPASSAADFSASAGTTAAFTWDNSTAGNNELADNMANVISTTFNNQSGVAIYSTVTPGLSSDATSNTICAGDNITFTATGGNTYEFFVDNVSQGSASTTATFSSTSLTNNQVVTVKVTDANGCSATHAGITVTVNALPTPGLTSDATSNTTLCAGDNVTFTATGGTSYQFFIDNVSQGAASATATFSTTALTNGQVVTVAVTDGNGCSATHSGLTMVVNPLPTAGLTSDDADNTICAGDNVTFTASGISTGSAGNSLNFNNSSTPFDQISGTNTSLPQGAAARTIEIWYKDGGGNTGFKGIFGWGTHGLGTPSNIGMSNTGEFWHTSNEVGHELYASGSNIKDGNWHHLAMTYDGTTTRLYVDGVLINSGSSTLATSGSNIYFGVYSNNTGQISGYMDEARVWNFAKTVTQINAEKDIELAGNETGLVAYYNFNQGVAGGSNAGVNSLTDATGNSSSMTLHNFALNGASSNWVSDVPFNQAGGGTYEFFVNNVSQGAASTTATFSSSSLADGDVVKVVATDANGCSGEASITMTVNAAPTAGISSDATNDEICAGETITFTGTGAGAASVGGGSGNALNFVNSDRVTGTNASLPTGAQARTIEAWIKTDPASSGDESIFEWGTKATNQRSGLFIRGNSDRLVHISQSTDLDGTIDIRTGQWVHVAATYDGTTTRIYVNGVLDGTKTQTLNTVGTGFVVGSAVNNTEHFDGTIDEVRVWNVARSASDIQSTMNTSLSGSESGLVAYYDFNQGGAGGFNSHVSTLTDATGNGNGTLSGFTLSGPTSNWVTSTAAVAAGTGGTYEFFVNNVSQGAASSTATFSSSSLVNGDKVKVRVTNANGCVAESSEITVTVNALPTPGLTSNATNNTTLCAGDNVTFTATGGTSYEFFVDNVSQGAASATATFSTTSLTNGQVVTVAVTDGNGCSATHSGLTMVVNPLPTAGLTSDDADNTICAGDNVTFTATGGTSYEFFVDNVSQGAASATATFSTTSLTDGQTVTVAVTDGNGCSATSAGISTTVNALPTPGISSDKTNDEICAGETITFTGTGVSTGGTGTSLNFSTQLGTQDRASSSNSNLPQGTSPFTVEVWVKSDLVTTTGQETILAYGTGGFAHHQMVGLTIHPTSVLMFNTNNATTSLEGNTSIRDGNWHHCAVTYDGSVLNLYIDGILDATKTLTTTNINITGNIYTLGSNLGAGPFFDGTMDEVRVWNFVKTGTQINAQKDVELTGSETGLVSYINFNDGTGTTATDLSPSAANFTLHSFTFPGGNVSGWSTQTPFAQGGSGTYEFFINNVSQGAAGSTATFSSSSLANGDKVKVRAVNGNGCVAESAEITVTVNALPTPGLSSDDSDSRVCTGQSVTFTATGADEYIFMSSTAGVLQAQSATATYTHTANTDGEVISVIGVNTTTNCQQASTTTFTLDVDGCHTVSGTLVYKNTAETPMGNVVITVAGPGLAANTTITTATADGAFSIDNLFDNETYTFSYATTKTHGGINSTDALLALLDAVNIVDQTGLNASAADVDINGSVLADDALDIQLRFVFSNVTTFPGGQDWVFDEGSFTPTGDITGAKLYALAMGDINGSYIPNSAENGIPTVNIINDGQMVVNDGDRVLIPVRIKSGADVGAMSLSMYFPSNAMTIHDVTLANGVSMMNSVSGDEARVAWADINSKLFADNDVVYFIDATVHDVAAYNVTPIGVNIESEFADGTGAVLGQVVLGVPTLNSTTTSTNAIEAAAASVRSFPNPFSEITTIEYDLPSTSLVSVQIFNSLGQELATLVNDTQAEGTHRAIWNAGDQASGVYYYTITVTDNGVSYKEAKQIVLMK